MAYGKYRESQIKGEAGTTWYVEIWKKNYSGSSTDMNLQGEGFEVKWTGEGGTRNRQFLTSECIVYFYAENNTDESFIYDVFEKGDKEYFVRIYKNSVSNANIWWFGWVQPSFDTLSNEPFPYPVKIIATDSIGVYKEREDDSLTPSDCNKAYRINNHINDFGSTMSLFDNSSANESPIPQNHKWFKTGIDWFRNGDTYEANDPFYSYYITRAAYREDVDKKPLKYKKYDVLKGSLQTFNTIGFLSDGHYYFIQPNNKIATDGNIRIYNYLGTDNEVASGGDIADESINLTIDQSTNYILASSTITYDPVLKSVSCDFVNGESTFLVPDDVDLTSGFSAGLLQGDADEEGSMSINFAATHKEVFNRNQLNFASSDWDLVNAGHKTTALLQIKIGTGADTRYLKEGNGFLEWGTDTTVHTITLYRGKSVSGSGSILNNVAATYVTANTLRNQDDIGDNLSLSGADDTPCSIERDGDTYTAETSIRFGGSFPVPLVSGEVVITLTATNEYTPYYYNPPNSSWAVDTGLINYSHQTPSTVTRTTESGSYGQNTGSISLTGYNTIALNTNQVGLTFTTNQSSNDAFENLDLGEIEVGQTTTGQANFQDSIYSVQYNTGNDASPNMFAATEGFRANDTGSYLNILQLLTSQFLQLQTEPLEILQADVFSANISPIKNLKYSINDNGVFKYYQFLGGTFKAQSETMSGEWFKINSNLSVTIPDPDLINAGKGLSPSSSDIVNSTSKFNTKVLLSQVNENSLGTTNVAIDGGSATTSLTLLNDTRGKVYNGQKLLLTYADGTNPLTLTASSTVSGVKIISITSFTPELDYPTGSVLSALNYDLTNVITGGGSTSPGGSNTQVQFNDSGAFGASANFTYDSSIDKLILTSSTSGFPRFEIHSNANSQFGSQFNFKKDRGQAPVDSDSIGSLRFVAEDSAQNETYYGALVGKIQESQSGQEGGRVYIEVASHDGDAAIGFDVFDGDLDDEVDVNIANGISSLTTIKGNLAINGEFLPNLTNIKILPRDFIAADNGRALTISDGTTGKRSLQSFSSTPMFASVFIPPGFKATKITIYGNDTQSYETYEANINSVNVTSLGTGAVGTLSDITDTNSTSTNYLLIELQQSSTSKVFGGSVIIDQI